jgi:hypothetical protein
MRCGPRFSLLAAAALIVLIFQVLTVRRASAVIVHTAVPIPNAQDAVVHDGLNQVFVTTSNGNVQRYDIATRSLLTPWTAVGVNLRSLDTTADGSFLYIADQSAGPTQGVIRKVNAATGAKTNLFYDLAGEGAGAYDIVRLSNNRMLFSANHQFSGGGTPLRFIDLSNDAISLRPADGVERQTDLFRSRDGRRVFMTGGNTSAGDIRVYNAPTDSYLVATNIWVPLNGISAALSPDGSLLAFQGFNVSASIVHAQDLSLLDTIPTYRSGLGFNPFGLLFMADWETELFRIYDPTTLSQIGSFPAGFDLDPFLVGNISFTANGQTMVYQDGSGLHVYDGVPVPEPTAMAAAVVAVGARSLRRKRPRARETLTGRSD